MAEVNGPAIAKMAFKRPIDEARIFRSTALTSHYINLGLAILMKKPRMVNEIKQAIMFRLSMEIITIAMLHKSSKAI